MQERKQTLRNLAIAYAEAEKVSKNLRALTQGPIKVDGLTIPQTNPAWRRNNLLAANKIDAISESISALNPDKLTIADLRELTEGLENIVENFRYNTKENRNAVEVPNHVYDSKSYYESLENSSVSDSYIARIDYIANKYVEPLNKKFSIIEHENETEVVFRDLEEEQISTKETASATQKFDLESVINSLVDTVRIMPDFKRNQEENKLTLANYNNPNFSFITQALEQCQEKYGFTVEKKQSSENISTLEITLSQPIDERSFKSDFSQAYYALDKESANIRQEHIETRKARLAETTADLTAKLNEAEARADIAMDGAILSGGISGTAVVVGVICLGLSVALGPIGWGILAGVALAGLAGLIVSAVTGYAAETEADAIEAQIPPDGSRGYPDKSDAPQPPQLSKQPTDSSDASLEKAPAPTVRPTAETPGMKQP